MTSRLAPLRGDTIRAPPLNQSSFTSLFCAASGWTRCTQEATIPNFTNDAAGFDHQFAAGYIVTFLNEQDAFFVDPKGYLVEMQRCTPSLLEARIIDGKLTSPHDK